MNQIVLNAPKNFITLSNIDPQQHFGIANDCGNRGLVFKGCVGYQLMWLADGIMPAPYPIEKTATEVIEYYLNENEKNHIRNAFTAYQFPTYKEALRWVMTGETN